MIKRMGLKQKGVWLQLLSCLALLCLLLFPLPSLSSARETRLVTLTWEPVEFAQYYEAEITLKSGEAVGTHKSTEPSWAGQLAPGQYRLRLRSIDDRDVPSEWSEASPFDVRALPPILVAPAGGLLVKSEVHDSVMVAFAWERSVGAVKYRLDIEPIDTSGKPVGDGQKLTEITEGLSLEIKVPVASSYRWTVTSIMDDGGDGDKPKIYRKLTVVGAQLASPVITVPEHKYVQSMSWSKPDHAASYSYLLERRDGKAKAWVKVEEAKGVMTNEVPFSVDYLGGRHRLTIRSEAPLRKTSPDALLEFNVHKGDRSPAAINLALLRASIAQPDDWQFNANYLLTMINYKGLNPQANSKPNFQAIGGTGRLGVSYIPPKKSLGGAFNIDMSGFTIGSQNFTYVSSEASLLWRKHFFLTQVRASGGVFYRELPDLIGLSSYEMTRVAMAGPRIGFDAWHPLTYKLGVQFNASATYNALGLSTPNGEPLVPTMSYQIGAMGSLRLRPTWVGFMGYAYRLDRAAYKAKFGIDESNARPGDINSLETTGHYLNWLLEIGF